MKEPDAPEQKLAGRFQRVLVAAGVALVLLPLSTLFRDRNLSGAEAGEGLSLGPSLERMPGVQAIARRAEFAQVLQGWAREDASGLEIRRIEGEVFRAIPTSLESSDAEKLRELFCRSGIYRRPPSDVLRPFRPNWCLEWRNGNNRVLAMLDLTSAEMRTFSRAGNVRTVVEPVSLKEFRTILEKYGRPAPARS